jgi:uncharacterized membrane protein YkoI
MKKTGAVFGCVLGLAVMLATGAEAGRFKLGHKFNENFAAGAYDISQYQGEEDGYSDDAGEYAITASEAAAIAKRSWPGSKVLRVQLLPSGVYAVTLKQGGEVSRVLVDASSGDLS